MANGERSYSDVLKSAYGVSQEDALTTKLRLYYSNPDYFTRSESEELESQAIRNGIYFRRSGEHRYDDTGVIEQFVSGFAEGAVLLGWADEPDTQAEKIANKLGHLFGFAPDIIAAGLSGGTSLGVTGAKLAAKTAVKKGVGKAGGKALGVHLGADFVRDKLMGAAKTVSKYAGKGGGKWGLEGPIPVIGTIRSLPMRAADLATDLVSKKLTEHGMLAAGYFAKGTVPRHMMKSGLHLGLASAVSSAKEGPEAMWDSFKWGGIAGVAFGGIGELTYTAQLLGHKNPKLQLLGKAGVRKAAGALMGAGFQGGMSSFSGAPIEDQIYEYLLGAFFGAGGRSVHEVTGNKFINDMQIGKVDPETGGRARNWYDIYKYKETAEWAELRKPAQEYVKEHINKITGHYINEVEGTDIFVKIAEMANLENISLTQAGEKHIKKQVRTIEKAELDPETNLSKDNVVETPGDLAKARKDLLLEASQELIDIEKENKGLEIAEKGRFKKQVKGEKGRTTRDVDMEGEDLYVVDRAFAAKDEHRIGNIRTRDPERSVSKGVGTRIFNAIKKEFIGKGRDHIIIDANPGSEGFWEKMGFEFVSETVEGYPIESSAYSGTKRPPKGEFYGRYTYRYDLKPELEAFESKHSTKVDYSKSKASVDHYTKEMEKFEAINNAKDDAAFEDVADFQVPRNRLDFMATDIQKKHTDVSLAQIRRDFHLIREDVGNNYAKFVAELSKKYPDVRLDQHDLKHFLMKAESNRKVPIHTWSEVDGELRESREYGIDNKRNVLTKPKTEIEKRYGDADIGPITRVEIQKPDANNKQRRQYLEPFETYYIREEVEPGKFEWVEKPAISSTGWRGMQADLDAAGHYIISAKKDDNVLIPYKYHKEAINYKDNIDSLVKEMEKAGYKGIKKDMDADWDMEYKKLRLDTQPQETIDAHKAIWRKKVASNLLWARDIEGASNFKELSERWGYKDVVDYNKRVSLMNGNEIPMKAQDFTRRGDRFLNKNGKFEFIIVNDDHELGLIKGYDRESFKNMDNKDIPYTSQLDGVIELPPKLWQRFTEIMGSEGDVGFMKPVIVIHHPELGNMLVKTGMYKTGPTHLKLSGPNKMILWSSSVKAKGKRDVDGVQYNPITKKWEGKTTTYELDPSEFKINLDISETSTKATKHQQLLKQMFGYANREQVSPVDIDIVYDRIISRAIQGFSDGSGKFVYNDMVTEYYKKGTTDLRRHEIEKAILTTGEHWPDRLSRKVLLEDVLTKNPDSFLAREFLKYLFAKGKSGENTAGEYYVDKQPTLDEMYDLTRYERILSAGKYSYTSWLYDESVRPVVEKAVESYLNNRMLKPRWRDGGSGAGYYYPYSVGQQMKHGIKPGQFVLGANWKSDKVLIRWRVSPSGKKIPLVDAWNMYNQAKKEKSSTRRQLEIMEQDLEFVLARSPMGGLSGARLLKFMGFSDKPGWGMITHPKDDFYMGGLDKDGDSGKWFQGLPKEMKDMFRVAQNELEMPDGRAKDIKDPNLDAEFGIGPDKLSLDMSTPGSAFMPNMRIEAGRAAWSGKKAMGVVENAKQQIQIMLSTVNMMGGRAKLPVYKGEEYIGELEVKIRDVNQKTGILDERVGDTFRYYGYNASNRATDASNYPNMSSGKEIKQTLLRKAFEFKMTGTDGKIKMDHQLKDPKWLVMNSDLGIIAEVNRRLYSKNWSHNRRWNTEEIQSILKRMSDSELPWQGILAKMARDITGEQVDFSRAGELDPLKVVNFFRDKQTSYRNPFAKHLLGRVDLRIAQWDLPKGYFKGDKKNSFRFDSDVEDVVGADLTIESGTKAFDALRKSGKTEAEAIEILDRVIQSANDIKVEAETSQRQSRANKVSTASSKHGLNDRIRAERGNIVEMAAAQGIDPRLFLRYWDMYFISPLRYQSKEMKARFEKEQQEIADLGDWFFDKFGEKVSATSAEKFKEQISDNENAAIKGILGALRKSKRDYYKTDQLRFARETQEIPLATLQEYLTHKTKMIESLQKDFDPNAKKVLDNDVNTTFEARQESREVMDELARNQETPLEEWAPPYELAKKYGKVFRETLKKGMTEETLRELQVLSNHLNDPKNAPIKESFAQFFADFTASHEKIGRPIESMTPEDVRHLNNFFRLSDSGEALLKYSTNSEGKVVPVLSKWMHHSLYPKVGAHAFVADRQVMDRYAVPLRKANGELIFVRAKQPVSAMSYLNQIGQTTIRHKDKFVNFEQEYRDQKVLDILLDETVINDQFELFDIAIAKYLKKGSGIGMSSADAKYYESLYNDQLPKIEELLKGGKKYRFTDDKGKKHFYDVNEFTDLVVERVGQHMDYLYKKWYDPTFDVDPAIWDANFEKQFDYAPDGKMSKDILRKALKGITYGREMMGNVDVRGIRTMLKIENEMVLEEIIAPEIKDISDQYTTILQSKKLSKAQREKYLLAEQTEKKRIRERYRRELDVAPKPYIPNYWPQLGHLSIKANEAKVIEHVKQKVAGRYDSIIRSPEDYLSEKAYNSYQLGLQGKPGGRTLEEIALIESERFRSRMESFLQRDVMRDGGDTEVMARLLEAQDKNNGKIFSSGEVGERMQKAREMGFFRIPGNFKSRGKDFIPFFRTDSDVIKIYTDSVVSSYFNHLYALQAHHTIENFVQRNPMGKVKGKNALGESINVDLTDRWASFMRDVAKKVLGYPTHFTTEAGDAGATWIGSSKKMMRGYKRTLKSQVLNKFSRDKINAHFLANGTDTLPVFKNKKEEKEWLRKNEAWVDVLRGAVKEEANPLRVYGSGYYYTSDTMMVELIQKFGEKFGGRDANGNIKLPWKELPTDPMARRLALTRMVHQFGSFEAKWSLATLLTHPKTAIGNIFGGSLNTITNTSFRHWKNAGNSQYLLRNIFKGAKLEDGTKIDSKEKINRLMEELGVLEAFYVQEIGLDPTFSQGSRNKFMQAVVARMKQRGLFKSGSTDVEIKETIGELAQKYKVSEWVANKAAYFMRISERPLRQRAFLAQYLNSREALMPITQELPFDSPWLISQAIKGVTTTQFLYNSAARSNYSNTAIGKVMTRFQPFAWNSIAMRRQIYKDAKIYGFKPGSKDFNRFRRQMTMDLFVFALGNVYASSIFEYSMPPPMSWLQDTAQFFFGDEKERERAFFSQWPVISKKNVLAPLQPFTGPILRYPLNTVALFTEGGLEKFSQYYVWTWFPFGRAARDIRKTIQSPAMIVENATGVPLHQIHDNTRSVYKNWFPEEEEEVMDPTYDRMKSAYKGIY